MQYAVDMPPPPSAARGPTLRERKRERTRQAIVDAGTDLFDRHGYDETTVADIAAAADIGTRTFFSYFSSKEELLFPASDARIHAVVAAIAHRRADDRPADVLLRALQEVGETNTDMGGRLAALRTRLMLTVPAVRGRALQVQLDAQREIVRHLYAAFPDDLDEVGTAALVGAFIGAISGALQILLDPDDPGAVAPAELRERLRDATRIALSPWLQ